MPDKFRSFIEVQFPIAQLSLESYIERRVSHGKLLSLGKWWGEKPFVLTRAIILGCVFPASEDPAKWTEDLEVFLRCMCFDSDGMWKRKTERLPAEMCLPEADVDETSALFDENQKWKRATKAAARDAAAIFEEETSEKNLLSWFRSKQSGLEKRVFYRLSHAEQRPYCCRVDEMDGPPEASWAAINDYLKTRALSLHELVQELSKRKFGTDRLTVGDAFCGTGAIPFAAAELGCDVFASDLNPVAALLTWGALNLIGGTDAFRDEITRAQEQVYQEVDEWIAENGYETSEEGWRADIYLHCLEVKVPEWDGWAVPVSPSWILVPRDSLWVELVPNPEEKRFLFRVRTGGVDWKRSAEGTKIGSNLVCPEALWEHFRASGIAESMPRKVDWNDLIETAGGLRSWEKSDFSPRPDDLLQERLYAIRWKRPNYIDDKGRKRKGSFAWREPTDFDRVTENKVSDALSTCFHEWQDAGWVPSWRIEPGKKTDEPIRTRGWSHWHHLFTPRQLLLAGKYSSRLPSTNAGSRGGLTLLAGKLADLNSRLCRWDTTAGGGAGSTHKVFYNQALNTLYNFAGRSWASMAKAMRPERTLSTIEGATRSIVQDARHVTARCDLWITDPPYADAVNYAELSEFFLAWYEPHLKACFPEWSTHSKRPHAVKGDDAPFRVAMMECYRNLAEHMPENGSQVLMFTHKDTDVWEDLALIMWSAGLQVKQVWSVATETPGVGIRKGNYVQATYNMVLKKRQGNEVGFLDFITPQLNTRVREVITNMRDSEVAAGGQQTCGYTDTDYLLAAQAVAAEVITGYAAIEGMDLDKELRTPNRDRADSPLKRLMDNAKRTATDFLVPTVLDRILGATKGSSGAHAFWRSLTKEEKFLLKGLEMAAQGESRVGLYQDLGKGYGLAEYEALMGPLEANQARTKLPDEFPRPDRTRFTELTTEQRGQFDHSVTRHLYHALWLLVEDNAEMDAVLKHLVDCSDFWRERGTRHLVLLRYIERLCSSNRDWERYHHAIAALKIAIESHHV